MDRQQLAEMHDRLEMLRAQREQNGHETSAAKSIEPEGLRGTSLENAPDLATAFDSGSGRDGLGPPTGIDSQQVSDAGSRHETRPDPEIAEPVDRSRHNAEMARDDEAAKLAYYQALARDLQQREQDPGRGISDPSRGHGLG